MAEDFTRPLNVIGKVDNYHKFGTEIITGTWRYGMDWEPGKQLFAACKTSPHAHANILSVDTSVAETMPGVKAVCTYLEVPSPAMPQPEEGETTSEVTYQGEIVAAVAATDPWLAEAAVHEIKVEYEVLPFVTDQDAAIEPDAPISRLGAESNFRISGGTEFGDIDAGFAEAEFIYEDTFGWASYYAHNTPEPRAATAKWVGDELWIWSGSQNIQAHQTNIARAMNMDECKVHFISEGSGGAYGDRKSNSEEGWIAATLAKKAGMPVVCQFSRAVNATGGATHQSQQKCTSKFGCKLDGTLTAADFYWVGSNGSNSSVVLTIDTPNLRVTSQPITTNKPRTGPFRSVNGMHGTFVTSQALDQTAYEMGINPFDFLMTNAVPSDKPDPRTGNPRGTTALREVLQLCKDEFGWDQKFHAPGAKTLPDGRLHGVGVCYTGNDKGAGQTGRSSMVRIAPDGSVHINIATGAAAGGTSSALCAVVAETLGTTIDKVECTIGKTNLIGYSGSQAGSRMTTSQSYSCYDAATEVFGKMLENASEQLEVPVEQLTSQDGRIFITADPEKWISHADAVGNRPIIALGDGTKIGGSQLYRPLHDWPVGTPTTQRTWVASMAEIAVDQETGEIEILDWVEVNDNGRAFYPRGVLGQIEGAMVMQLGFCFTGWEQLFDDNNGGATINPDFLNQKNPTALDVPIDRMKGIIYESNDKSSIYGGLGCGEPPVTVYACFHNAFYNATGKRIRESNMYPARVLKALGKV